MSNVIDERIVQMRFDTKDFVENAKESLSVLDKLKAGLKLEGAAEGLSTVTNLARKFDFSGVTGAVEVAQQKFSALEVVAITALANITNSALNAGKQFVSSMSIDQATAGFAKYEEKTRSVQTIMAGTGKTEEEVMAQLEKLNWFTDETSYNFADMVNNIGKFTAAGVSLEDSVTAMMGIANEAAISGRGINEASRAMYNFAQALGTGSVKLLDWRSIMNANLNTLEFKETIIDTALELGTLQKDVEGNISTLDGFAVSATNFEDNLAKGWFTSDVLIDVFKKYGSYADAIYEISDQYDSCAEAMKAFDAQADISGDKVLDLGSRAFKAGQVAKTLSDAIDATKDAVSTEWMNVFENVFGRLEEASALWTEVTATWWDVFASGLHDLNTALKGWRDLDGVDGRTVLLDAIATAWNGISTAVENVKEAFAGLFPELDSQKLMDMTNAFKGFTDQFSETIISGSEKFKSFFTDVIKVKETAEEFIENRLDPVGNSLAGISTLLGDFGSDFSGTFADAEEAAGNSLAGIGKLLGGFEDVFDETFDDAEHSANNSLGGISTLIDDTWDSLDILGGAMNKLARNKAGTSVFRYEGKYYSEAIESTREFGEAVVQAGIELGTLEEIEGRVFAAGTDIEVTADNFLSTLSGRWLTLDVMNQTYGKLGDFIKQFDVYADSQDAAADSEQNFNNVVKNTGNSLAGIGMALGELNDIYKDDQSYLMSNSLAGVGVYFDDFINDVDRTSEKVAVADTNLNRLKRSFAGISAAVSIVKNLFSALFNAIKPAASIIPDLVTGFLGVTAGLGDNIVALDEYIKETDFFNEKIGKIVSFVQSIPEKVKEVYTKISDGFKELTGMSIGDVLTGLRDKVVGAFDAIKTAVAEFAGIDLSGLKKTEKTFGVFGVLFNGVKIIFNAIGALFERIGPLASKMGGFIVDAFTRLGEAVSNMIGSGDLTELDNIFDLLVDILAGGTILNIVDSFKAISDSFQNVTNIPETLHEMLMESRKDLAAFFATVNERFNYENMMTLAKAIAILAGSMVLLSLIDPDKVLVGIGAITALMKVLTGGMNFEASASGNFGMAMMPLIINQTAKAMKSFAISVLILTGAMAILSFLDFGDIVKGLIALTVMMFALSKGIKEIVDVSGKGLPQVTFAMILLATAMTILAVAVSKFGKLGAWELAKGLLATSISLKALINAVTKLAGIKNIKSVGTSMIFFSTAMLLLAKAVKSFGSTPLWDLVKGLGGLALSLLAVTLALRKMPANTPALSGGMILMGAALNLIALAFKGFGSMKWEEVGVGIVAMAGALTLLVVAMAGASRVGAGATGILVASAALLILAGALNAISLLSFGDVIVSLIAIAGTLAIFGAAAFILAPVTPILMTIAGAIALFGLGCLAAGAGILAVTVAITALATSIAVNAGAIALAIQEVLALIPSIIVIVLNSIGRIISSILGSAEMIVEAVKLLLLEILRAIIDIAPSLGETVLALVEVAAEYLPKIVDLVYGLIIELLELLIKHIPAFVKVVVLLLVEIAKGIGDNADILIAALFDLVGKLFDALGKAIENGLPKIGESVWNFCGSILKGILGFFGIKSPSRVMTDVGDDISQGLINGIENREDDAGNAMEDVGKSILDGITGLFSGMFGAGEKSGDNYAKGLETTDTVVAGKAQGLPDSALDAILDSKYDFLRSGYLSGDNYADGLGESENSITDTLAWVLNGTVDTANSYYSDFYGAGVNAAEGYRQGIESMAQALVDTAGADFASKPLAGISALLDMNSPSKKTFYMGQMFGQGFINGMHDMSGDIYSMSGELGEVSMTSLMSALDEAADMFGSETDIEPTITPVLDLSEVTDGAQRINGLFGSGYSMRLAGKANLDVNGKLSRSLDGINVNNSNVVSAITGIRNDIQALEETITNLQMVMDTGAVVGALAGPMDNALGRRALHVGRGHI